MPLSPGGRHVGKGEEEGWDGGGERRKGEGRHGGKAAG